MIAIMFNFFTDTLVEKQDEILANINKTWWPKIANAKSLIPKKPRLRHMCCAYVNNDIDKDFIMEQLSVFSEIESVFVPAERRLVNQ